jgi:hypothetical protein
MSNIVDELANLMDRRTDGQNVTDLLAMTDRQTATVIAIEILSWLGRSERNGLKRPLTLKPQYKWSLVLIDWVGKRPELRNLFVVDENQLDFAESVPGETRLEFQRIAAARYNPTPIV